MESNRNSVHKQQNPETRSFENTAVAEEGVWRVGGV